MHVILEALMLLWSWPRVSPSQCSFIWFF